MDYMDWVMWKFIALCAAAFGWGIYCGVTGRPLGSASHEDQTAASDQAAPALSTAGWRAGPAVAATGNPRRTPVPGAGDCRHHHSLR